MFIVFPALIFVMLCVLLPELLCLALAGLVGYIICKVVNRRSIGLMIIMLTVFCALNLIIGKVKPIIESAEKPPIQENKKYLDQKLSDFSDNKYFQYIITPPK